MTRAQFVAKLWPLAVAVGPQFGLSPVAMLAHALKEAGANNARAAARHNYFGFMSKGKHLVYASDEAGFKAYARRMYSRFRAAVEASADAAGFAQAIAFSNYLNEPPAQKAAYAKSLASFHRAVAQDVQRLGLEQPPLASSAGTHPNVM